MMDTPLGSYPGFDNPGDNWEEAADQHMREMAEELEAINQAIFPVRDWYDESEGRLLSTVIGEIIADFQEDRSDLLDLVAACHDLLRAAAKYGADYADQEIDLIDRLLSRISGRTHGGP